MKKLHLICNAHLDPIWQWTWDEGITAAISTFKSAADLCDEFDYIFCHGEALLYEAIEQNVPELFERIKAHVLSGKWVITGGWYLQPDCLMPSGETFVRQIARGRSYFREKFGVEPTVATNYDSFGHSVGLVQILAKNGYSGYMACRPYPSQFNYPSKFFVWRSPDGSEVISTETPSYNSRLGHATEKIYSELSGSRATILGSSAEGADDGEEVDYILWGVGNHGGGPSRKDLRDIEELNIPGVEIVHSTPEALFADGIRVGGEVDVSLVTCMPGCYSSMARIKRAYRRTEAAYYNAERISAAASLAGLSSDYTALDEAEKRMLLATFHDILPGSCTEAAEAEGLEILGAAEKTAKEYRTRALLYLAMSEECAGEGEFPVFAFNYMPYEITSTVEVEFMLADQNWSDEIHFMPIITDERGERIPAQVIKENSTLNLDWRKKAIFTATLKPMSVTRFTVTFEGVTPRTKLAVKVNALDEAIGASGLLESPVLLDMYDDTADPWGMSIAELTAMGSNPKPFALMTEEQAGEFTQIPEGLPPVHITEDGAVYTGIEALYTYSHTNAAVEYKLYRDLPYVDLKLTVEFADKNKLVRVKIPIPEDMRDGVAVGDGPYVWERKPSTEITFQKWVGVEKNGKIYAVLNDGVYSGKVEDGYIHLTLLRGSGYCFHPINDRELYPHNRYLPRIDCGRYTYNLRIIEGDVASVCRAAEELASPPYAVNIFPIGGGSRTGAPTVRVEGDVVTSVIKQTEGGYLLRIYNPNDTDTPFTVTLGGAKSGGVCKKREVMTVIYKSGEFVMLHDSLPV